MNDNEIIKAFESLYKKLLDVRYDLKITTKEFRALNSVNALVNRQKAEIERLQKAGEEAVSCFNRMETLYKIKCKELEIAKSEARKEIVDKIKSKFTHKGKSTKYGEFTWDDVTSYELDNLLKEIEEMR